MAKKNLVIVESPAKAKTITKYLNGNTNLKTLGSFIVVASMGHIRDLKKNELGIDIEKGFKPIYVVTDEKKKTVADLKSKAATCDVVWLASDYDREGEGIAMHIKEVLNLKNYKRITFTEITPKALQEAVMSPRDIDYALVDSQETRRILDRVVGFKLSPLLWKKFTTQSPNGLSAGRVQSSALHLIIQKEHEIKQFQSEAYWHFHANIDLKTKGADNQEVNDVKLYKDKTIYKEKDQHKTLKLLKDFKNDLSITDVHVHETKKNPDLPFITSSLQQEAYSKLGYPLKRTMHIAQELYEKGYITYMRTDSYNISDEFKYETQQYISSTFGDLYLGTGTSRKTKNNKNAQEAHEAIRPTQVGTLSSYIELGDEHKKLYEMIWKRTVAFFMSPMICDELNIKIVDSSFPRDMFLMCTFNKVKFNGFMILYRVENEKYDFQKYVTAINSRNITIKSKSLTAKNTWQSPPPRYNESSIVKVLESEGIGRPSTYAGIMNKLFDKRYIVKSDVSGIPKDTVNYTWNNGKIKVDKLQIILGAEKTRLLPTDIGIQVDKYLTSIFPYIVDKSFTSNMEADLDKIAIGEKSKLNVLQDFWKPFSKDLKSQEAIKQQKILLTTESLNLKVDGVDYTIRYAKYGPVIEYTGKDGKKTYINIKPYLGYVRKQLNDLGESDIKTLLQFPKKFNSINGKETLIAYGPFGIYLKYQGENISLPRWTILKVFNGELKEDDLVSAIEYKANKTIKQDITADKAATPKQTGKKKVVSKKN